MASLSSPGIGSGLDINTIVSRLMQVEQQPLLRLQVRQQQVQAELSGFGQLKSAVSNFQSSMDGLDDATRFRAFTAKTSDDKLVGATASATAARGVYGVEVVRLAENHRLAAGTVYADSGTTVIGTAGETMTIDVGGTAFTVSHGGKTLAQIRDAINDAAGNSGVTASILKDDSGYRLTLSADATGSGSFVGATFSAADPFALSSLNVDRNGDAGFTAADLDAVLEIEGQFTVTSTTNTVTDAIEGVTLALKDEGTVTVNVERDLEAARKGIKAFVDGFNGLIAATTALRGKELATERGALNAVEAQLRAVLNASAGGDGAYTLLFQIGISTGADGRLTIDNKQLDGALAEDLDGVAGLFARAETGYAVRFSALADDWLSANGMLAGRSESYERQLAQIEQRGLDLEARLTSIQDRLFKQFNALDGLVAQLQSTGSFLTQQLAALPAANRNKS